MGKLNHLATTEGMSAHKLAVEFDEQKIDTIFAELDQCHLPGAAVGIAIAGRPVYRKGFGLASMELPVVLSPRTRLRLGSTSKHFTCLAYMLLCEDGSAGIDDPVGKYFPELHPVTHKVTMRQLMGNTSGLHDVYDIFSQFNDHYTLYGGAAQSVTSVDLLALYRDIDDVNTPAGTTWIYNNGGWLILSAAIERITGQTLEQVMWKRIFEPVGMYDTLLLRSDTGFVPNRGAQHVRNPAGDFEKMYFGVDTHIGAGAIVSTVDDMLRWLAHMDAPRIGSPATWAVMKAPQRLASETSTGYGLGLMIDHYRGVETLYHAGNAFGGNAQMLRVPAAGLDVMIMVNRQDVFSWELADKVLDACLPELDPVKESFPVPIVTGTFRSQTTGFVIQLFAKKGKQAASFGGGIDCSAEPDDSGVLWIVCGANDSKQGMTLIGDLTQPTSIRFSDFGNIDELVRVQRVKNPDPGAIVGRYRSEATGTEATISQTEAGPRLSTAGRFGSAVFRLECLAKDTWRAKPAGATRVVYLGGFLSFDADAKAFRFSNSQTRSLPFRRCT